MAAYGKLMLLALAAVGEGVATHGLQFELMRTTGGNTQHVFHHPLPLFAMWRYAAEMFPYQQMCPNSQERAQLAYRKNLLYVHSLRELTVNAVLPGIRSLLADLRAQQIPVGLASVSLNAPTILAALELREFFTFCADASQLKNSKPDPEIFLAACAGLGVPPQACIGIEDAQAGIDAINASGMRSVGIGAGLTGAQLLLPSTESLTWPRLSAFWQNV